jgi:hypothetical protein
MVFLTSLWIPILLSAVIVFAVSSIIHMLLPYHRSDIRRVPREDELLSALRGLDLPPGDYGVPHPGSMAGMKDPAFAEKMRKGPIAYLTIAPGSEPSMAVPLLLWFVYAVVVSLCAGYIAGRALPAGTHYLRVFRFVGASAFMGYSLALLQQSIWYKRSWGTTLKSVFDGLVYALFTAGTFGWLWPR